MTDKYESQKSNSLALWSLTSLITVQLITWVFWGAWFTFSTINNTKLLEEIHKHKLPSRVAILEHQIKDFEKLFDKMDELSRQINAIPKH